MLNKLFFIALLISFFSADMYASYPFVRNFPKSVNKGGSQSWSVVQADNDWIYVANNKGLLEYDGVKWSLYSNKSASLIRSLYFDAESKRIYAGSYNELGYFERDSKGELHYSLISNSAKLSVFSDVWNIHKLGTDFVFQTETEIIRLVGRKLLVHKLYDKIYQSAVVRGRLIIAQLYKGVSYFDGRKFVEFSNNAVLKNKVVRAILPYKNNQLLFVTDSHGVFRYDGKEFSAFKTDVDNLLMDYQVFCAAIKDDVIAFGTVQNGLITKNLSTNHTSYSSTFTGMQNNTVLSLFFDKQENIWMGLDKGIDYCMVNSTLTDLIGNPNQVGAGYTSCLYADKLYLGTNQGLYYMNYDVRSQQIQLGTKAFASIKGQVWNLAVFNGELFCSCDKGLYVIKGNKLTKVSQLSGVWCVKPINADASILMGAEYDRFFILKKIAGQWTKTSVIKGMRESDRNFLIDATGKIWISIAGVGVYRLTLNAAMDAFSQIELLNFNTTLSSYQRIVLAQHNNQIIASTVNGFYVYDPSMRRFVASQFYNDVFGRTNHVSPIQFHPNATVWLYATSKIAVVTNLSRGGSLVDSSSFNYLQGKLIDGFEHMNVVSPSNIVFATENGFTLYTPSTFKQPSPYAKLAFKSIYLTQPVDSMVQAYLPIQLKQSEPVFSYRNNSIRFDYVLSEYRNENSVLYSYNLDGFDNRWSEYSVVNTKEYSNLPPGNYVFKVRALNLINLHQSATAYAFRVSPPWYQTITAYIVYIILFATGLYLLMLFIEYKTDKAEREMELLKEQENKEQEKLFLMEAEKKEKEIIALKNKNLEYDLKHKSQDLASSTMNLIRKNEALLEMNNHLSAINKQLKDKVDPSIISKEILSIQKDISANIESDSHWERFQDNFDLIYDNYLLRLAEAYPALTHNDKRICAYLRMDLSSKDIAPLVNTTYQSVEMTRHRLRKKLNLDRAVNLTDFLQHF